MRQREAILLLPLVLIVLTALACQILIPSQSGDPPAYPSGKILFHDDFSNPDSGWNRVAGESGLTDYDDGLYRILVTNTYTDIWSRPGKEYADVRVEVDAIKIGGDRNNRFGLICRLMNNDNFYIFIISSDGYYGIGKIKSQQFSLIGMEALQPHQAIKVGSALNRIRADCVGDQLSLFVNGVLIAQVNDLDFPFGDVGLIAGTYETPDTDIRFDNFFVRAP
jgi:hypothetical protein